jgi:hypothetical protein
MLLPTRDSVLNLASNKTRLLEITAIIVVAILLVPVILPHMSHPWMIYHILLHIISIILAVFLSAVSFFSYNRTRSTKILLTALSFFSLLIVELLDLSNVVLVNQSTTTIPGVDIELSHIFLIAMLGLFGAGILKIEKL